MQAGDRLGKYEIKRILGSGAMGTVYEAWDDSVIQRRVAIKAVPILALNDSKTEEMIARFRLEARAAGSLIHPNIVTVLDYGETADLAYIVMEYVDGPTLKSLLDRKERFELRDILRIMQDLLSGLECSHEGGVVHRDIKPSNLMLTSDDRAKARIKIADFGIARIESVSLTQLGTVMGTPSYMSPEQFMGQRVDPRTDVYSAGVLLYELLTGDRPFEGHDFQVILYKALHTTAVAPSALSFTAPRAFDDVVARAMAKRPDDRFPSAAAFAEALLTAASGHGVPPVIGDTTIIRSPDPATLLGRSGRGADPEKRRLWPILLGALAVVFLVGGGGAAFLLLPTREAPHIPTPPATVAAHPESPVNRLDDPAKIRAQLRQIVASEPCALTGLTFGDSGDAVVSGIAGPGAEQDFRRSAAGRTVPSTIAWHATSVGSVFCPTLDLLRPITPQPGGANPGLGLSLAGNPAWLKDGEPIRPRLVMPGFAGYLRVDYIANDGYVRHLYPQVADSDGYLADPMRAFAPAAHLDLGDPPAPEPAWLASGDPPGTDMIIAVASSQPLFDTPRSVNVEAAADYIRDLEAAVKARMSAGARVTGSALPVETLPK
jgi:serine/threonine-protein kinase